MDDAPVEVKSCHELTAKTKDPPYANSHFLKTGFGPTFLPWAGRQLSKSTGVGTRVEAARLPTTPRLLWMLESSAVERRRIICNLIAQGGRNAVKFVATVSNICG